eukprot:1126902-Amphidinium_carterae.3
MPGEAVYVYNAAMVAGAQRSSQDMLRDRSASWALWLRLGAACSTLRLARFPDQSSRGAAAGSIGVPSLVRRLCLMVTPANVSLGLWSWAELEGTLYVCGVAQCRSNSPAKVSLRHRPMSNLECGVCRA